MPIKPDETELKCTYVITVMLLADWDGLAGRGAPHKPKPHVSFSHSEPKYPVGVAVILPKEGSVLGRLGAGVQALGSLGIGVQLNITFQILWI